MIIVIQQEEFSKKFGETVGLPQPVPTRWNSVLRHINSFLKKDMEAINSVMAAAHQDIEFTNLEWVQLRELSDILAPFAEATDLTQGDQVRRVMCSLVRHTILFIV